MKPVTVMMFLLPRIALADREITVEPVCVEIQEGNLDDTSRATVKALLARTLEQANQLVVETGCTQTFRVGHHVDNDTLTIRITGPAGTRRWTNASADQLPEIYRAMVHALLAPAAPPVPVIEAAAPAVEASAPPAPFPVTAYPTPALNGEKRGGWHLHMGVGSIGGIGSGLTMEAGYRFVSGDYALDVFGAALGGEGGGSSKAGVELFGLRKTEDSMVYGGGGISTGQTSTVSMFGEPTQEGSGFALEATGGLGFGRLYLQADVSLPLYQAGQVYPASFSLALGVGRL
jgi:hypothetical protein